MCGPLNVGCSNRNYGAYINGENKYIIFNNCVIESFTKTRL